jgi:ABC-type uncharacterized transport system substrate-binding protein
MLKTTEAKAGLKKCRGLIDEIIAGLSPEKPLVNISSQLLTEIVPGLARVAVLSNPANPSSVPNLRQMQAPAQSLGIELHVVEVRAPDRFESAFAELTAARAGALIVLPDGMLYSQHLVS